VALDWPQRIASKAKLHKSDGGAAAHDSDTNFELVIPKFDATGELSDEVKAINHRIRPGKSGGEQEPLFTSKIPRKTTWG